MDLLEVIRGFLKDDTREWYIDNKHRLQYWDEGTDQRHSFVPKFMARFKTKAQVEVWHRKCDALEHEEDEDISEYATRFKKIYKQVDPQKRTPIRIVVRKFINSLLPKYVEMLTIMRPDILDEAIEAAMDVEASQRVKNRKRDQTYMVDTIKELHHEIHNLQVAQTKPRQSKPVIPAEPLQGTRDQIMPFRREERFRGRGRERGQDSFI